MITDWLYPEYNIAISVEIPWWLILALIVGFCIYRYLKLKEEQEEPFDMIKVPKKALTFDNHCVQEVVHREEKPTWKAYTVNDSETRHTVRIAISKDSGDIASVRFLGYTNGDRKIVKKAYSREKIDRMN